MQQYTIAHEVVVSPMNIESESDSFPKIDKQPNMLATTLEADMSLQKGGKNVKEAQDREKLRKALTMI